MKISCGTTFLIILGLAIFSAAAPGYADNGGLVGAAVGGVTGGIIGSSFAHGRGRPLVIATGVGLGATAGNAVGQQFDHHVYYVASAETRPTLYSETPSVAFTKAQPNYVGPPSPPPTYIDQHAQTYCRPYSQETSVQGRPRETYGTVCLQPDGTWRPQ